MNREYQLGNEPIPKLLWRLSLPATVAMFVNALYNIVDTIFIGQGIGYLAIGGLTIAFPVQMVIMAIAQMIGIGAASAASRSLGANDKERANLVTGNAFLSVLILGIVVSVGGLVFISPLLRLFGATEVLLPYSREYLRIILIGAVYFPLAVCGNNLIRAEGNAKVAMISMSIGAMLNIILDYIFIFPLQMGIRGAALATILSQLVSVIYVFSYLFGGKSVFVVKLRHFRLDISIVYEIVTVGFASFARQVAGSLMAVIINNSLGFYGGDLAISVYGVVNRIIMFLVMPLFGIVQGMQPIVGFNYGAGNIDRVKETLKLAIIATTIFASFAAFFGVLSPGTIIRLFDNDPDLIAGGTQALRIVLSMIPIIGAQVVGAALFQSLGKALPSLLLTLSRQVILFIPLALILPRLYGLGVLGIWLVFPISDFLSTIFTVVLLKREMRVLDGLRQANLMGNPGVKVLEN